MTRHASEAVTALSDEELVDRIRCGDVALFDLLYDRYFPRVFRFLDRRLPSRADTEETVQEVFVNLFASLHGFRGEAPFAAWVFGLTRRTLAARFKRKRPKTVPLVAEDEEQATRMPAAVSSAPDPLEAYEFRERLGRMRRAVQEDLSEEQWTLFRLHHLENRSIQDIARRFAKTEDAVKSHLYRARKLLLAR
jgi:RNA polymerase sigma-70 factor (ECF subfamily)